MGPRTRRASVVVVVAMVLGLLPMAAPAVALPGDGDPTYGTKGFTEHRPPQGRDAALGIRAMADGRVVVLAYRDRGTYVVTRLLPSGARDTTYGGGDGQAELTLGTDVVTAAADRTAFALHPDGAVTLVAFAYRSYPTFSVVSGRLTPAGSPDTAWAPGGTRMDDVPGVAADGPALHRLPSGEQLVVVRSYRWDGTTWYHTTIRLLPTLSLQTREVTVTPETELPGPTLIDAAGHWLDVRHDSYRQVGGTYGSDLVITARRSDGTIDTSYGVAGVAHVLVPGAHLDPSAITVVESGTDLVVAAKDGILRVDSLGRLRTELGDAGVVRLPIGDLTELRPIGSDLVLLTGAQDGAGRTRCAATLRLTATLVPVAGWGDGGRSVVCPRPDRNDPVGVAASGGRVLVVTTSAEHADRDDSVTVTGLGGAGTIDPGFGTGGRVDLRNGVDGPTTATSMALLPDGGMAVGIDAPDGPGVARLDASGALVTSFGRGGFATSLLAGIGQGPMALRANGGFLVGGSRGVVAFTSAGSLDVTFGDGGFAAVEGGAADVLELGSGRILVVAGIRASRLIALRADGERDTSAGADGVMEPGFEPRRLARRGAGALVVGVEYVQLKARAYTGSLTPDGSFAAGGVLVTGTHAGENNEIVVAIGPLGRAYVATRFYDEVLVIAITPGGAVDPTFAAPDFAAVNPTPSPLTIVTAMAVDPLGRLLVAGAGYVHLERLLPTGAHDATYGDAGVLELAHSDVYASGVVDLAVDAQGRAVGVARSYPGFAAFRTDTSALADLPTVSMPDLTLIERGPGTQSSGYVSVTLDRPSTVPVTVMVEAVDGGTATSPSDYDRWDRPQKIVIWSGQTTGAAYFHLAPDGDVEPDETIRFRISAAYQAVVGDGAGTVTINDDDALRSLTAGNGFVRVGLGPPADEPPEPSTPAVAGYYLAASQDGVFVNGYVTKGDVTTASINGLRNGVPADVTVTPFAANGQLLPDRSGTVTPRVGGPAGNQKPVSAPTNVSVVQGDGHLTVRWGPPVDDGGTPVWAYVVAVQDGSGGDAVGYTYVEGRSISFDGLTNGQRYTVGVAPVSALGFGGYVSTTATPKATGRSVTDPQAPSWVVVTTSPDRRSATIALGAPPDDGGSPIVEYLVTAVQRAKPLPQVRATPARPQVTISGLDPALGTTFLVITRNRQGKAAMSLAQAADGGAAPLPT